MVQGSHDISIEFSDWSVEDIESGVVAADVQILPILDSDQWINIDIDNTLLVHEGAGDDLARRIHCHRTAVKPASRARDGYEINKIVVMGGL